MTDSNIKSDKKSPQQLNYSIYKNEINLPQLLNITWHGKWWIIPITIIFGILSVIISISLPNKYQAKVIVAPAQSTEGSQFSSMLSSVGGLASLANTNVNNSQDNKVNIALQVLKSQKFIGGFIKKHNLLLPIMGSTDWNSTKNMLVIDSKVYNVENNKWVRKVGYPFRPKPSLQEAYKKFSKEILNISQDKVTGIISISIEFYSPILAKQWANWLVKDLNDKIRIQDMIDAENSIKYLNQQLSETSLAENRKMLYQLIEQQTKNLMLTNVQQEYVFKTIDPAVVPEVKNKPKRAILCIIGTIFGFIIAVLFVLIKYYISAKKE